MDNQTDVLARTTWGEARGEGADGMRAVASVVMNRLAVSRQEYGYWWGNTIIQICQKPAQFSCWLNSDPNRRKMLAVTPDNAVFAQCLDIAEKVIAGDLPDNTGGATHYHTLDCHPDWAVGLTPTAIIGHQAFFRPSGIPALRVPVVA